MPRSRSAVLLLVLLLGSGFAARPASAAEAASEASWTVTPSFTSAYFFRGVRVAGPCFQPSVDYANGPVALGVWSSVMLDARDRAPGDSDPEVDLYGAYTLSFADDAFSLVPGFSLYTYPSADRSEGYYRSTFEPSLACNFTVHGVRFTPKVYYDTTLDGATGELSAAFALPLTSLGTELDFTATAGTYRWTDTTPDSDPADKNWGDYWLVGVSVPFQITATSKLALSLAYTEGRNNFYQHGSEPKVPNEDAVGRAVVSLSYTLEL